MRNQSFHGWFLTMALPVIIADAQVSANVPQHSCFDLELQGTVSQIESALTYLDELDLEVLHQSSPEEDGW
ncbi:hypothetical protein [Nostoc commune]|nr:hypothetical protein [Nostoc commune]